MLVDVVEVRALGGHRLWVRFDDGVEGEVDLASALTFSGVFARLADPEVFARVSIEPEWGTLVWPGDVDFDSERLHSLVRGEPLPRG